MKKIILLSSLLFSITPAFAENWVQLEAGYFVDADSQVKYYMSGLDNVYSIWTKSYNNGNDEFRRDDDYFNVQVLVDCDNAKTTVKSGKIYLKNGKIRPESVSSLRNDDLKWINVSQYSKSEVVYNYVCQPGIAKKEQNSQLSATSDNPVVSNQVLPAADIYKQNVQSMLYIETKNGSGSGVILENDGTFVTCFHCIAEADFIKVKTPDGKEYYVDGFKYINPLSDVAILTINSTDKNFVPIKIPNGLSNVGDKVYTISNPQGLEFAYSDGMISKLSKDNIQFTAPISSGSSGGALLNAKGELLGIITSFYTNGQNLNLALPNEYYISKLSNSAIKNVYNQKWLDFLISNASEDQFKLMTDYAFNSMNWYLMYKFMKPYTKLSDFPKHVYPDMGLIAVFAQPHSSDEAETNIMLNDAINWFEIAVGYDQNTEASLLCLTVLYPAIGELKKADIALNKLKAYPDSYRLLQEIFNKYSIPESDHMYSSLIATLDKMEKSNIYEEEFEKFGEKVGKRAYMLIWGNESPQ